jgi:hypothetical protein
MPKSILELTTKLSSLNNETRNIQNVTDITSKVNFKTDSVSKLDHAAEIEFLMSVVGREHAINLQIENLINTYGYYTIKEALNDIFE